MTHDPDRAERRRRLRERKRQLLDAGRLMELHEPRRGEELMQLEADAVIHEPDAVDGESVVTDRKAEAADGTRVARDGDLEVVDDL